MRILDYSPNFGTLSAGFENFSGVEVTDVVKLAKDAEYGYNSIHKQWALASFSPILTYEPEKNIDLAIFNPDFGENVGRKGASNFFFYDFQDCLDWLTDKMPKFAIFQTEPEAVRYINTAPEYVRDGFGQLSKDKIIYNLQQMGFKAHLLVLDEAEYGIPLHRKFAFYIATPEDFDLRVPRGLFTATGKGRYNKYRTVSDAIGDLDHMGEWVEYGSEAQNSYQKRLRNEKSGRVTWNFTGKLRSSVRDKIIQERDTRRDNKVQSKGYNILQNDKIVDALDECFYLASSKKYSIHPKINRPLTIREGCRILGLPDELSFDLKTSKKSIARMLYRSVSPFIGEILGLSLGLSI